MTGTYTKFYLSTLCPEFHARTCGYWYVVQSECSTPHTAFAKREHLLNWMRQRGLSLTEEMPEHGQSSGQWVKGTYRKVYHWSNDELFELIGDEGSEVSRELDNADYTLSVITTDADGLKTVHLCNPNVRDRLVYDYRQMREIFG